MRLAIALLALWAAAAIAGGEPPRDWEQAVGLNDTAYLREHLGEVDQVDRRAARDKTALMAAAAGGDPELMRALLRAGADPGAENATGGSVLMYAAWKGDTRCLTLLLEREVALDHQARNGWTALMMAAAKGHAPAARLLLAAGADPNVVDIYGWTPLMRAAYAGREAVVQALLAHPDTDLEAFNDRGQTALHLAVIGEQPAIARALLARGTDPDREDYLGNSPREIAEALDLPGCDCGPPPTPEL